MSGFKAVALAAFVSGIALVTGCGPSQETESIAADLGTQESAITTTTRACTTDADCGSFCNSGLAQKCVNGYCQTNCDGVQNQYCCSAPWFNWGCTHMEYQCSTSTNCANIQNTSCNGEYCQPNGYTCYRVTTP